MASGVVLGRWRRVMPRSRSGSGEGATWWGSGASGCVGGLGFGRLGGLREWGRWAGLLGRPAGLGWPVGPLGPGERGGSFCFLYSLLLFFFLLFFSVLILIPHYFYLVKYDYSS